MAELVKIVNGHVERTLLGEVLNGLGMGRRVRRAELRAKQQQVAWEKTVDTALDFYLPGMGEQQPGPATTFPWINGDLGEN